MKSTKKSLIASALSLVLCVSMLLGTTYAWFTDSVTSGKNKIIAGNLDVELTHTNAKVTNQKVQDATDLFGVALWEPGVIAWENLTVTNVGNLALKYALNLNVFDKNATTENHDLTEVIKVAVIDGGFTATGDPVADRASAQAITTYESLKDFQKTGNLAGGDSTGDTFGVVLYWQPTDNDNLYNLKNGLASTDGQPLFVEFGVNLVATQDTVEADSFDKLYDLSAQFPVIASFPSIKAEDLNTDKSVKIEEKGAVKSAEVPAKGATSVFNELKKDESAYSNDLTLTLNVNETGTKEKAVEGGTEKTIDFDINMSAVMTSTNVSTKEVITQKKEKVETLTEFITIEMNIGAGFTTVSTLHKGVAMQKLNAATDTPTDTTNGGYFYNPGTGVLTLKTMTLSPFSFKYFVIAKDDCTPVLANTVTRTNQNNGGDRKDASALLEKLADAKSFSDIVDHINNGDFEDGFVHATGVNPTKDVHGLLISGNIKLDKDLYIKPAHALSFRFIIDGGETTIDLNGHKIVQLCGGQAGGSSGYCLFTLRNGAVVNVTDSSKEGNGAILANTCVFDIYDTCVLNLYRGKLGLNDTISAWDYADDNSYETNPSGSAAVTLDGTSTLNVYGGSIVSQTNVKVDPEHLSALYSGTPKHTDYVSSNSSQYGMWYTYDTTEKTVKSFAVYKFDPNTTINNIGGLITGDTN